MTTKARSRFQTLALAGIVGVLVALGVQMAGGVTFATPDPAPPTEAVSTDDVLLDEVLTVRPGAQVVLDLSSEDVTVEEGRGGAVRVVIEGETEAAREFFRDQNYDVREEKGGAVLLANPARRAERRRTYRDGDTPTVRVQVPAGTRLSYEGTSGNLRIDKLDAEALSVDTGSGDVELGEITAGEIEVDTGSGNVQIEALQANAGRVDTGSGDVAIRRSSGSLDVDTGSGDVELDAHSGPVVADTGSGDVSVRLAAPSPVEADTGSGDVMLALTDAELDVDTNGDVDIDASLGFVGTNRDGNARGTVGAGGPEANVGSGSGDVSIRDAR